MSYKKQNFESGQKLYASQLNHIEDGIVELSEEIADLKGGGSGGSSLTLTKYVDADYFTSYSVNKPYDELLSMVKEGAITTMSARSVSAIGSIEFHTMHCICIDTVDGEDRVSMLYRDVDGNAYWVNMKPDNTIEEGRPSSGSPV